MAGKCNLGSVDLKKKVKLEGIVSFFVEPLYGEKPDILFDRKNLVPQKQICEKYQLCNKGLHRKKLKLGRDF
jgi:hypothetical protein